VGLNTFRQLIEVWLKIMNQRSLGNPVPSISSQSARPHVKIFLIPPPPLYLYLCRRLPLPIRSVIFPHHRQYTIQAEWSRREKLDMKAD
jgi:hypothetical protein